MSQKAEPAELTVDDVPLPSRERPLLARFRAILMALPDGKLRTLDRLCADHQLNRDSISADIARFMPATLRVRHGHRNYYGNPKTIAAYRKKYQL